MQDEKVKKKKKFKWWYILIALFVIGAIGALSDQGEENPNKPGSVNQTTTAPITTEEATTTQASIWEKSGTYKVGSDIPAGEYVIAASGTFCYVEVAKDSTGTLDSIVANENVSTHTYFSVSDGQYLKIKDGEFALSSDAPAYAPENGVLKEGMYKVGKDIEAGEYKVTATDANCYYASLKGCRGILDDIVANSNIALGETAYITVSDGQYLQIKGGEVTVNK